MGYDHTGDLSTTEESEAKGMIEPLDDHREGIQDENLADRRPPDTALIPAHRALMPAVNRTTSVASGRADVRATQIARPFTALREMVSEVDESDSRDPETESRDPDTDYENEFQEVADKAGLYYKVHRENPMQEYQSTLYKLLPRTQLMKSKVVSSSKPLTSAEELAEYKFAVQMPFCEKGRRKKITHERFRYFHELIFSSCPIIALQLIKIQLNTYSIC